MRSIRILGAHLAKEVHDARSTLIGIPLIVLATLVLVVLVTPHDTIWDPVFPLLVGAGTFVLWLLGIASDLVPGESRRGTLGFLSRLPSGLGAAFAAKAAFLVASGLVLTTLGWLAGSAASSLFGGEFAWPERSAVSVLASIRASRGTWTLIELGVPLLAVWTFAASCWLPRGSLSIPAGVLVLGVFFLPVLLLYAGARGFVPAIDHVAAFAAWLAVAALVVAGVSFVRGRRLGRGLLAAGARGLVATAVVFAPAYVHASVECADWNRPDPADSRGEVLDAILGKGERHLFVNVAFRMPGDDFPLPRERGRVTTRSFVLDLESGATSCEIGTYFRPHGDAHRFWWTRLRPGGVPVLARVPSDPREWIRRWVRYHDGSTGRPIRSGWSDRRYEDVEAIGPSGPPPVPPGYSVSYPRGLGWSCRREGRRYLFDPYRHLLLPDEERRSLGTVVVRPGRWLVRRGERDETFVLYDPDTRRTSPVAGGPLVRGFGLLPDGRVLRTDPESGAVDVLDPEAGATLPLGFRAEFARSIGRTRAGAPLLSVRDRGPDGRERTRFARLDAVTGEVRWFPDLTGRHVLHRMPVATLGETALLFVLDGCEIVRADLGAGAPVVLWPR